MTDAVLEVQDLATHFFTRQGVVKAVDGVSFSLAAGEIIGLVGESGSGKSVTGFSVLGLVDPPGRIVKGSIRLDGEDLVGMTEPELRQRRGRKNSDDLSGSEHHPEPDADHRPANRPRPPRP